MTTPAKVGGLGEAIRLGLAPKEPGVKKISAARKMILLAAFAMLKSAQSPAECGINSNIFARTLDALEISGLAMNSVLPKELIDLLRTLLNRLEQEDEEFDYRRWAESWGVEIDPQAPSRREAVGESSTSES